jgi:transposase-like protein
MLHRIRLAMQSEGFDKLDGQVEVDETFVGGKAKFMHMERRLSKSRANHMGKTTVMGLLERVGPRGHSRVRAKVVRNARRNNLSPEVREQVERGAEVHTDALKSYNDLDADYIHQVVDHSEEYVRGHVHTNGLENFWSLLKRAIHGTYVTVSPWQLQRYVEEEVFRYNNRKMVDGTRFQTVTSGIVGKRLTYRQLTGYDA